METIVGKQSIQFQKAPYIVSAASVVGKKAKQEENQGHEERENAENNVCNQRQTSFERVKMKRFVLARRNKANETEVTQREIAAKSSAAEKSRTSGAPAISNSNTGADPSNDRRPRTWLKSIGIQNGKTCAMAA